jgi:DNA-binding transcriptional LysR family regulator
MDNLGAMQAFVKVIECGGFSAAARELRLSKSAVSKQVARLENRLQARLLNRTTRRLSPTEVGITFYQHCQRILAEVEEAETAVLRLHREPRGVLRLNAPVSFGASHVAPALPDLMRRHPELKVDMVLNDRLVDLVDEGFDLAIRIADLPDSSLVARKLAPNRLVACASPAYWRVHGVPSHPNDLKAHNCLVYAYLLTNDAWVFRGPDGPLSVRITGNLSANNGDALRAALVEGLGVTVIPSFIVGADLAAGRLQAVLEDYEDPESSIFAVYPHNRHLSAKVRVFVDFLAERFGPRPYWDTGIGA